MSIHEFVKKKTPNIVQSLFRREIGLFGIYGQYGKETTNTINAIIHRQLIQRRAPRSPPPPQPANVKIRKANGCSRSESVNDIDDGRVYADDIEISDGVVFVRSGNSMFYINQKIQLRLRQLPVLGTFSSVPGLKIWCEEDVWCPTICSPEYITGQHRILFIIENPGHVLHSFDFDNVKKYKTIHLDPEVQFELLELSPETLILNSVKGSIRGGFDHAVADFIIFNCPDLRLVTRCRMTKAAVGNSSVEIRGDFIFLINGHRIELFDLREMIKSSYQLEPTGYVPGEGMKEGIPYTHLVQERPVCLYAMGNINYSHFELEHALWPPHYVTRNQQGKFQVLPLSKKSSNVVGIEHLNLVNKNVSHGEDDLCIHPDQSGRLILTGYTEIRIILMNHQNKFQDEFGIGTTHFTVQFSKTLANSAPNVPEPSRRPGLRAIRRRNYVGYATMISVEELGIIRWDYSSKLDLFVILEFSPTIFQITILDNQCWEPIALINLSDLLRSPIGYTDYLNWNDNLTTSLFSIDATDGCIGISQNGETGADMKVYMVNLLSDDT